MTEQPKTLILAIEAAVSGGSISLIRDGIEIANWIGPAGISKAENLLADIDRLLDKNDMSIRDVGLVAVSAGPGSFTGIRIGFSTALGLMTGLGIKMASESALKAMAYRFSGQGIITTAVPAGRDTVCYQSFDTASGSPVETSATETQREADFIARASGGQEVRFALHADVFEKVPDVPNCIDFGRNIAFALGMICSIGKLPRTEPIFISKNF